MTEKYTISEHISDAWTREQLSDAVKKCTLLPEGVYVASDSEKNPPKPFIVASAFAHHPNIVRDAFKSGALDVVSSGVDSESILKQLNS